MNYYPVRHDESAYVDYIDLFSKCFPASNKYNRDYLDWLYRSNPDGQVVGFDARDGHRLVAHYACIPVRAWIGGEEVNVLLSLNTATHPDYQGKGLFSQLAERTYAAGAAMGYDCVYGVANAHSTPGFTRKLKFQLIAPLRAMVGVGSLGIDFKNLNQLQFQRSWSESSLAWRCASPVNTVIAQNGPGCRIFLAPALAGRICMATAEIGATSNSVRLIDTLGAFTSPLKLFLGLIPPTAQRRAYYVDIPNALRPSPLNLIYRSLSGRIDYIDKDAIFFNFLDFDAY